MYYSPMEGFLRYAAVPHGQSIEKYVQKLDQDVRRTGRINRRELDYAFIELKNTRFATGTQSLMIIRCCGNLIPEERPEVRTELVKKIWTTLESMGVPLDVSHYNALLRVYIENEYKFSPTDFLSELHNKGVEPNRVTFQRLIMAYCQRGNIEGATRILEYMKEKQMPVNENVFSSLINGHFQAGDGESAMGILNVMKQANIKPSNETYTVIMCGHSKTGDIAAIKDILAQCEKEEVDITDKDLLEVIYSLAINNHTDLIDQLSGNLRKTPGYNQDAKNAILRLIVQGQDEAAFKILRTMTPIHLPSGDTLPVGNFFIKQLVKCQRPAKTIISFCEELKASGENEYALTVATEASLINETPDLSRQLLTTLSQDQPVCQHYYWPVLVQYGKKRKLEGVHATLVQMTQEIGSPVSGETTRDYVAPYVSEGELGIMEMRKGGISLAAAAAAMVGHLLGKSNLKAAVKIASQFRANYSSVLLCKQAVNAFVQTNDLKSFITLVRMIVSSGNEEADKEHSSAADRIILSVAYAMRREGKLDSVSEVLKAYLDSGIGISSEAAEDVQSLFSGEQLTPEISSLLTKLTSPDLVFKDVERSELPTKWSSNYAVHGEASILESIKAAESKGEAALGLKRQLLGYYCLNKDIEKAEQLFKELEKEGFEFVTGTLVLLMDMYINCENLPHCLKIYDMIFKDVDSSGKPNVQIDHSKIMRIVGLMFKENQLEDALKLLSKHKVESDSPRGFNSTTNGWRLLNSIAERKDPELLKTFFDALVENNFIEPNNITLGPLIKVHLLRDDVDSALAQFEECCQKYRATPWKNEIACKLIMKEDPVSLQKLTDLSTDIHGEINSLYDLVLSFIECGRIRQARKILETPGLRLRNQRINSACERYGNDGNVNYLENLIEATKDLNHIDRADIYYHLLSTYCKVDDVDKALGLWTQMQDEDVQPSDEFLIKLGQILEKHNRPIPFAVPDVKFEEEGSKTKIPATPHIKDFRKTMNSRNVDEALKMLSTFNESDLSTGDRSKLLHLLINNGRIGEASKLLIEWLEKGLEPNIRTISTVVSALANIGDVDTLNEVGRVIDTGIRKLTSFTNRYAHCMVEAGRVNDLLSDLEKGIKSAKTKEEIEILQDEFPRGGIFSVLQNAPDSITKVEEISELYAEKGIQDPFNALWAFHFASGNFEKANEFWSKLTNKERIMFQPILKRVHLEKNIALCWDLVNLLKANSATASQLGPVYSCLIDVENISGNLPECERILDEALKDCSIENITRGVLLRLKRSLEAAGRPFKYTLPPRKQSRTAREDTSSDSDSDSDSEDAQKPRVRV